MREWRLLFPGGRYPSSVEAFRIGWCMGSSSAHPRVYSSSWRIPKARRFVRRDAFTGALAEGRVYVQLVLRYMGSDTFGE